MSAPAARLQGKSIPELCGAAQLRLPITLPGLLLALPLMLLRRLRDAVAAATKRCPQACGSTVRMVAPPCDTWTALPGFTAAAVLRRAVPAASLRTVRVNRRRSTVTA